MSNPLKFVLLAALCFLAKQVNCDAVDNFIEGFPYDMLIDQIYTRTSKLCICGITSTFYGSSAKHGYVVPMYNLVRADFDWIRAAAMPEVTQWTSGMQNNKYTAETVWYSPTDGAFVSYKLQAIMMDFVLKHFLNVLKEGDYEITPEPCNPYVSYYGATFMTSMTKSLPSSSIALQTADERKTFASDRGLDTYFDVETVSTATKKKIFTAAYPMDFTKVNVVNMQNKGLAFNTQANIMDSKGKMTPTGARQLDYVNGVVCKISGSRTGAIIFADMGKKKYFYGTKETNFPNENFNYKNVFQFIADVNTYKNARSFSGSVTNVDVFMHKNDYDPAKMRDAAYVKENAMAPNSFEVNFCYSLLNPLETGKFLDISRIKWTKIMKKYIKICPIIGNSGGIRYRDKIDRKIYTYHGMTGKPTGIFDIKPDPPQMIGPDNKPYIDYNIDISTVQYPDSPDFGTRVDKTIEIEATITENIVKKVTELPQIEPVIQEHDYPQKTQEEIDAEINALIDPIPIPDNLPDKETEQEQVPIDDPVQIPYIDPELEHDALICKDRRDKLILLYDGGSPKNQTEAITQLVNMMKHPIKYSCIDFELFVFSETEVRLRNPNVLLMKYIVRMVTPDELKEDKQDPDKKIFEIRYYNDYFDDTKEILQYIPAADYIKDWDKYGMILMDFKLWVDERLGDKLNLQGLNNRMRRYIKDKLVEPYQAWSIDFGPSGPMDKEGSSSGIHIKSVMNKATEYVFIVLRLTNSNGEFYDIIYQSWFVGETYMVLKLSATQLNFQVMVNIYSHETKLHQIFESIFEALVENYLGEDRIVSMMAAKQMTFDAMKASAMKINFGFELNKLDIEDERYSDPEIGHNLMLSNDDNAFMFSAGAPSVSQSYLVRGFIHNRENIPVMNLFFNTGMFKSEYIIPLVKHAKFYEYVTSIFTECFDHFAMLIKQVRLVEDAGTSSADLEAAQLEGKYSMNKLIEKVLNMLESRVVYGCISNKTISRTELEKDESGASTGNIIEVEQNKKVNSDTWDSSGDLTLRRCNRLFKDATSKCENDEAMNPIIVHLYPTFLENLEGYALSINDIDKDGEKEIKTTYHFIRYQDYAHSKVFEDFIGTVLDQLFDIRGGGADGEERL